MMGQTAFCVVYGVIHTGVILLVVSLFFRLDLSQANMLGSGLVLLAGSLSFIGLGVTAAVLPLLYPERGAQMTHVIQALVLLVSGVYYPVSVLPRWLQPAAGLSPATYVLEGMRGRYLGGSEHRGHAALRLAAVAHGGYLHPLGRVHLPSSRALC